MTTHLFYHAPDVPEAFALQSWLSLWPVFLSQDTVIVLDPANALPLLPARATVTKVAGYADGTPFAGFAQAINRGAGFAQGAFSSEEGSEEQQAQSANEQAEWICVWRSEYLYPHAYHNALDAAQRGANLILPYETFHGLHYCDAAWCGANGDAILWAAESELLTHAVVAPVYQTRAFPHFAIRADLWRRAGGLDARLCSERAVMAEWTHRVTREAGCIAACPFEMIAFRQNIRRRIETRLTAREMQQAEQELASVTASPQTAHALLHDVVPPLRPARPAACYSPFPRPARPVTDTGSGTTARALLLRHAQEQLQALALSSAIDHASFLTRLDSGESEHARACHVLGTALYAQGRRNDAVPMLVRSVNLAPTNRQHVWDLLMLWRDLCWLESGIKLTREWLEIYPDDAEMLELARWFAAQQPGRLDRFFAPGALVFDVGAHYAVKAQEMLRQGAGALVCFDCQPNCVAWLQEKYRDAPNVAVMPVGLADAPGSMEFSICSAGEGISTFSPVWKTGRFAGMNWNQTVTTPVTTLDIMIAQFGRPAYCKIDVEGFEYNVLRGLTQPIPCVSFEFSKEFLAETRRCMDYLVTLGFDSFNAMLGDDQRLLFGQSTDVEGVLAALEQSPDQLLWGDIYAFCSYAQGDVPDLARLAATRPPVSDPAAPLCAAA